MVANKTRQTPAQKRANAKFAAKQEKKMGKPRPEEKVEKMALPISKSWLCEYWRPSDSEDDKREPE